MKTNIRYYSQGQNVYEEFTKHGRVHTDLLCIAPSVNYAKGIVDAFNACLGILEKTTDKDTGLSDIRQLAINAIN